MGRHPGEAQAFTRGSRHFALYFTATLLDKTPRYAQPRLLRVGLSS